MNRLLAVLGSALLVSLAAPGLSAQALADRSPAGPTIQAARAGISAPSASAANGAQQLETPSRESAALMIVGGAALLAGLLIGGGAGTAIAVGGTLIGLYGLWIYVR
ncbi:MAG TPA: hypothetical protein VFH27_14555 [Longimicrobiaceae bacterium]|nr:hypothetical protein [Longimicrobiaceae bacterium]